MQRKKTILLRRGKIKELAAICKVSPVTVRAALRWSTDSDTQNLVRKRAVELGFVRKF